MQDIEIAGTIVKADCFRSPAGLSNSHEYRTCLKDLDVSHLTIGASAAVVVESTAGVDSFPYLTGYVHGRAQVRVHPPPRTPACNITQSGALCHTML